MEKTLAYDARIGNITSRELEGIDFERNVDVCVLAKNSNGVILNFDESQCTRLPASFNAIMKKFIKRPSSFFKIYEMDKKNLARNIIVLASAAQNMFSSLPLIVLLCMSWIVL